MAYIPSSNFRTNQNLYGTPLHMHSQQNPFQKASCCDPKTINGKPVTTPVKKESIVSVKNAVILTGTLLAGAGAYSLLRTAQGANASEEIKFGAEKLGEFAQTIGTGIYDSCVQVANYVQTFFPVKAEG